MVVQYIKMIAVLYVGVLIAGCGEQEIESKGAEAQSQETRPAVASDETAPVDQSSPPAISSDGQARRFQDCSYCPEMVAIPEGEALIGGTERAGHSDGRADPSRSVDFASFAVARSPTTRAQFRHFVERTNYQRVAESEGHKGCHVYRPEEREWRYARPEGLDDSDSPRDGEVPVSCVSWDDAHAYVSWLSETTEKPYRLLAESEWEYVARAGVKSRYLSGDCITAEQANFDGTLPADGCENGTYLAQATPVGQYPANGFGLHDVSGNVWEWTHDCWNPNYREAPEDGSAWMTGDCSRRVMRGGSWYSKGDDLQLSRRVSNPRGHAMETAGFRVAMDWPVASPQAPEVAETSEPLEATEVQEATEAMEATEEVKPVSDIPVPAEVEDQEADTEQDAKEDLHNVEPPVSESADDISGGNEDESLQSDEDEGGNSESTIDPEEDDATALPEQRLLGGAPSFAFQSRSSNRPPRRNSGRFDALLDIAPVSQDSEVWCWLAVGEMIFRYYNVPSANPVGQYQCGIAAVYFPETCYSNCARCVVPARNAAVLNDMITGYPRWAAEMTRLDLRIRTRLRPRPISTEEVHDQIDDGLPVVIGVSPSGYPYHQVSEHVALIVGYHDDAFIVNDPFPFSAPQNPYLQAGARMVQPGQYKISERMLRARLQWKETIYDIRCTGEHCDGGGPSSIRYGRRCDVGQFVCGPFPNQSPLPVGAQCHCRDNRGRPLRGEVVQ